MMAKLKKFFDSLTLKEREKRKFRDYDKAFERYESLSNKNLQAAHIDVETKYQFYKNNTTFTLVTFLISVIVGVWNKLFEMLILYIQSYYINDIVKSETTIFVSISAIIVSILIITCITFIYHMLKNLYDLNKQLLIIRTVIKNREQ